jgi:hypothetical protein
MSNQFPMLTAAGGKIDMQLLKSTNAHLHKIVSHYIGEDGKPIGGSVMLPVDIADRLEQWLIKEEDRKVERMQADEQRRLDDEIKRVNDLTAARARLEEWVKAGLLNTQENANAIDNFIRTAPELNGWNKFTPKTVDVAISFLGPKGSNVLTWAAPPETVTITSPEPVVSYLDNGEVQLPIGTQPTRAHSVAQLKDLDKRTRESLGLNKDRQGWHGGGSIVSR